MASFFDNLDETLVKNIKIFNFIYARIDSGLDNDKFSPRAKFTLALEMYKDSCLEFTGGPWE